MSEIRSRKLPRHPLNPRIMGVRMSVLRNLYQARLRRQVVAESLAGSASLSV